MKRSEKKKKDPLDEIFVKEHKPSKETHDPGGCKKKDCDDYPRWQVLDKETKTEGYLINSCCKLCRCYKPFDLYSKKTGG